MYQKFLVPLDGSENAESVLSLACRLARLSEAEITLLRVIEYPADIFSHSGYSGFYPNLAEPGFDENIREKKDAIHSRVKGRLERLAAKIEIAAPKISIEIKDGPVVDAILDAIEKLEIDLIIMSSTGEDRNPWKLGAIASRLLREAQVPVILMRLNPDDAIPEHANQLGLSYPRQVENHHEYSR